MAQTRFESATEKLLRQQFPLLYVTLITIVVALAIHGLVLRMDDFSAMEYGLPKVVLFLQFGHFIFTAAVFWWISTSWVVTVPWKFGLLDALSVILLLVVFDLVSAAIGVSFEEWMLRFSALALATSVIYRFNGRRGIEHTGRSMQLARLHWIPTAIPMLLAVVVLPIHWYASHNSGLEPMWALIVVTFTIFMTALFAYADYWLTLRLDQEPGRFDK